MADYKHPLRVGVGGPVGSGKTALLEALCKAMRDTYHLAVVTNDIYTKEDQRILTEAGNSSVVTYDTATSISCRRRHARCTAGAYRGSRDGRLPAYRHS